jgi:hypothetical protein
MNGNRTTHSKAARLAITLLFLALAGQTLHAATLALSPSPASNFISTDGKNRFTQSLQGEFQDATTVKQFKVTIKNSSGTVLYSLPASTDSGAVCNTTTAVCIYYTNGTTYTAIKSGLAPGTYKVQGDARVYGKKADGSIDEGNFKGAFTSTIDYVVPKPYGWLTTITRGNSPGIAVNIKLSGAEDTIEGNTVRQIVSDMSVKVRSDSKACGECHTWATSISKTDFCNNKVTSFNNSTSKPLVLKNLFNTWKSRGCND